MNLQRVIYSGHIMNQEQELIQKHLLFDAVAAVQLYVYDCLCVCMCVCLSKSTRERERERQPALQRIEANVTF